MHINPEKALVKLPQHTALVETLASLPIRGFVEKALVPSSALTGQLKNLAQELVAEEGQILF